MSVLFFKLVGMSVTAGWLILAVLIARHFLGKVSRAFTYVLWMLVAVRLLCPFLPESNLSLVPGELHGVSTRQVQDSLLVQAGVSQGLLTGIWIVGVLLLLGYSLFSFIRLYRKLRTAVRLKEDVWQSEYVKTPFILGICSPKIYVPYRISEHQLAMVVAHERSHAKQKDHIIKLAAFILLAVYWFQPMVWVAYILLCRDIEIACDERVVKDMVPRERKIYSEALLSFSVSRHAIAACPVFFGEVGVKMRIKKILSYKKSPTSIRMGAAAACALLGICFLTNPKEPDALTALSDQAKPDSLAPGSVGKMQVADNREMTSSQESNASDQKTDSKKADSKEEQATLLRVEVSSGTASQPSDQTSDYIVASAGSEVTVSDQNQQTQSESVKEDVVHAGSAQDKNDGPETEKDDMNSVDASEEDSFDQPESSKDQIGQVGNGSSEAEDENDGMENDAEASDSEVTDGGEGDVEETDEDMDTADSMEDNTGEETVDISEESVRVTGPETEESSN